LLHNFARLYWDCGFVTLAVFLVLASIPSARFIRSLWHRVFLSGYIVFAVVVAVALLCHTEWRQVTESLWATLVCISIERIAHAWKTIGLFAHTENLTRYQKTMRLDIFLPPGKRIEVQSGLSCASTCRSVDDEQQPLSILGSEFVDTGPHKGPFAVDEASVRFARARKHR
jgi:hypothetical protein